MNRKTTAADSPISTYFPDIPLMPKLQQTFAEIDRAKAELKAVQGEMGSYLKELGLI